MRPAGLGAVAVAVAVAIAAATACGGESKPPLLPSTDPEPSAMLDEGEEAGAPVADSADPDAPAAPLASGPAGDAPAGSEASARALLEQFLDPKADHGALSRSLRPTSADYKALFDTSTAAKVEAAHGAEWDAGKIVIAPKDKQTEVRVYGATGAELATGSGAAREFPGGYKRIAAHLSPAVTFFAFRFVARGKDSGMAYDGLAFVNGHWVIAPKPWRSLDGAPSGDESAPPAAAHGKPGKPGKKPGGKAHKKGGKKKGRR